MLPTSNHSHPTYEVLVHTHRDGEEDEQGSELLFTLLDDIQASDRVDALIFFDPVGSCVHVSETASKLFGCHPADLPDRFDILHPKARRGAVGIPLAGLPHWDFEQLLTTTSSHHATFVDARGLSCTCTLRPIKHREDEVMGMLASYSLDESVSKVSLLETLLETLPIGVILADKRGEVRMCNKEALRITGREEWSTLYDTRPYILRTPRGEVLDTSYGPIKRTIAMARKELYGETFLLDFGGGETRRVVCDVNQIMHAGEPLYVGFFRDVTDRHERELKKDEFISVASHELRNPLTPLKGLLQIALQQHESQGEVDRALLVKSLHQVDRLTKLVDGLLDLSRLETGRLSFAKQSSELGGMLEDIVEGWRSRHGEERFSLSLPDAPILLEMDAAGIEQVINNLVDNALKFSPEDEPISLTVKRSKERVMIEVEDRGVGLDEETAARVFERFYQGSNAFKRNGSLGLGLYISRKIVEEHNGAISIRSERGERTVVEVSLPLR